MNRQLKRANEKSDKRRELEQARRKKARRDRVQVVRARAKEEPKTAQKSAERPGISRLRRRFANWYLIFVIFFIVTQAFFPQRTDTFALVTHAIFYGILGYFMTLWLYRRGTAPAPFYTVAFGVLLALGVEGLKFLLPGLEATDGIGSTDPNLLFPLLAVPGVVAGAALGYVVYRRDPNA